MMGPPESFLLGGLVAGISGVTKIDFLYDTMSLYFPLRKDVYNKSKFLAVVCFPTTTFDFRGLNWELRTY